MREPRPRCPSPVFSRQLALRSQVILPTPGTLSLHVTRIGPPNNSMEPIQYLPQESGHHSLTEGSVQ
jgi:hypothetical protein